MMFRLALSALGLFALAAPEPTWARDFLAFQSTTPILYRYAACALAQGERTAEGQLAHSSELRNTLEEEAGQVLLRFHTGDRRQAQLNLKRGFMEIDRDAMQARDQRKLVPPPIVAYLKCMGESIMHTVDYQQGVAVDYSGIEDRCASEHVLSVTSVSSEKELERIQILYRRFARLGRYIDNSSRLGAGISSTGDRSNGRMPARRLSRSMVTTPSFVVMDGSFLNLTQLPADKAVPDD